MENEEEYKNLSLDKQLEQQKEAVEKLNNGLEGYYHGFERLMEIFETLLESGPCNPQKLTRSTEIRGISDKPGLVYAIKNSIRKTIAHMMGNSPNSMIQFEDFLNSKFGKAHKEKFDKYIKYLFGDEDDEDDGSEGGGKRKSKKSRKAKKTRKAKKSKKSRKTRRRHRRHRKR